MPKSINVDECVMLYDQLKAFEGGWFDKVWEWILVTLAILITFFQSLRWPGFDEQILMWFRMTNWFTFLDLTKVHSESKKVLDISKKKKTSIYWS